MASDNFNRANESPLASPWTAWNVLPNQLRLVGNELAATTADEDNGSRYTLSSVASSQVRISVLGDGDGAPAIHCDSSGNGYFSPAAAGGGEFQIIRFDAGVPTVIGNTAGAFALNDVVRLRRSGSVLIMSVNGSTVLTSAADTNYLAGNPGVFIFNGTMRLDDWTDASPGVAHIWKNRVRPSPFAPGLGR